MTLTIAILFCDNDVDNLQSLVESVESKVTLDHEILLIDNRDDKSAELPSGYEVLTLEKNIGQYDARLEAVEKCNGDYIWFIDGDDDVFAVDESFAEIAKNGGEVIYFCAEDKDGESSELNRPSKAINLLCGDFKTVTYPTDEYSIYIASFVYICALWQTWIKREHFVNCLEKFPRGHNWKHNEDLFVLSTLLVNSKNVTWCKEVIYQYNIGNAHYKWNEGISFEQVEYLLKDFKSLDEAGRKTLGKYYELLFPKEKVYTTYIYQVNAMTDETEIDKILNLFIDALGEDWLCKVVQSVYSASNNGALPNHSVMERLSVITGRKLIELANTEDVTKELSDLLTSDEEKLINGDVIPEVKNPFLSIVVTLIDRDVDIVSRFIQGIIERVKIPYEVIVVDNRETKKDIEIDFKGARVISKGRNLYQFESKRWASLQAKGEFIWFVDCDDCILDVSSDLDLDKIREYPLISFDFKDKLKFTNFPSDYQGRYNSKSLNDICYCATRNLMSVCTWNKWYRKSDFVAIAEKIEEDKKIIISEDNFWLMTVLQNNPNYLMVDDIIYFYNRNSGVTSNNSYNYENAKTFLTGYDDFNQLIKCFNFSEDIIKINKLIECSFVCWKAGFVQNFTERWKIFRLVRDTDRDFVDKERFTLASYLLGSYVIEEAKARQAKYFLGDGLQTVCWFANSVEVQMNNAENINFVKCCISENEILGKITVEDFLNVEDKKSYLQKMSNVIPSNHQFTTTNIKKNCQGTCWCDYSEEQIQTIAISCKSCNLHCTACRAECYSDETEIDNYYKILESIKGLGIKTIYLTNRGEPFLKKERLFKYLESLTLADCKEVAGVTNGTLIDETDIDRLKAISEKSGIDFRFIISIDGITAETYKASRRVDMFDKVVKNAELLNERGMLITVNYLITELTVDEIADAPKFWADKGITLNCILCGDVANGDFVNSIKKVVQNENFKKFTKEYPNIQCTLPANFINPLDGVTNGLKDLFLETDACYSDYNRIIYNTKEEDLQKKLTEFMCHQNDKASTEKLYNAIVDVWGEPYKEKQTCTVEYWDEESQSVKTKEIEFESEVILGSDNDPEPADMAEDTVVSDDTETSDNAVKSYYELSEKVDTKK
jgi:hypothetical protein